MRGDICALIVVLVLGALALISLAHRQRQQPSDRGAATRDRLLKPRTPGDCPACRQQRALPAAAWAPVPPGCSLYRSWIIQRFSPDGLATGSA